MRKWLWMAVLLLLIVGIWQALQVHNGYQKGRDEYAKLEEDFLERSEAPAFTSEEEFIIDIAEPLNPEDMPERKKIDFTELCKRNTDVIGWIEVPAIGISYPLMQSTDNVFYLHHGMSREELFAGSIFLDCMNDPEFKNMNSIIYGHNMRDGSMFGKLKSLNEQEKLEECPFFWIYTQEADYLFMIFSIHRASNESSTYTIRFSDAHEFEMWLQKMKDDSSVHTKIRLTAEDKIVTLSTCTEKESTKQVVQGKKILTCKPIR